MTHYQKLTLDRTPWALPVLAIVLGFPGHLPAQTANAHQAMPQPNADKALADQLRQLRDQVSRLEKTVQQNPSQRAASPAKGMQGMGMGMGSMSSNSGPGGMKGGMGMMDDDKSEMSSMSAGTSQPMSGMDAMGKVSGAPEMSMQSALPGFPGASHLYHIGATGFFLDHPDHATLTDDQRTRLNQMREKAQLEKATIQRKIDEGEQQLFTLTGSDQPDQPQIQAKIREIADLGIQQRLAFIQAVGQAAQVLTDEQRQSLVGKAPMSHSGK